VDFIGINKFHVEDIEKMMQLKPGQYFDGTMLLRDKSTVEQIYGSYGYVFANVRAEPRVSEDASRMDLVYVIEEGKRYRVADIRPQIEGEKPHTNIRTVLNRVELQPGDIVDVRKLRRSEARLQRSQLFLVEPSRGIRPQIVVQPVGEGEDAELIGSKSKDSSSGSGKTRSASGSNRPSTGRSALRGQSPDDWTPDDQWISLRLIGQANPSAPTASAPDMNSEQDLPPAGALPDGRVPPPLKVMPGLNRRFLNTAPPPGAIPPERPGYPVAAPNAPPWAAPPAIPRTNLDAVGRIPAPAEPAFRSWGPVPTIRP
jgi:outer membrane protein insertion porin family